MIDDRPPLFTIALSKRCLSVNEGGLFLQRRHMEFHSAANIFPLLTGEEYRKLRDDIAVNGLIEPIWTYQDKILDGRNRYTACLDAGIEPRYREYTGTDPLAFVISLNLKRRHLSSSQLAVVALEVERQLAEEARKRMVAGRKLDPDQIIDQGGRNAQAAEQAAALVGTNRQYVSDAKNIEAKAPELLSKIIEGKITLPEAKKELRHKEYLQVRQEMADAAHSVLPDNRWNIYHADIATWIAPRQYDFIITDPPYPKEYLHLYETLADKAVSWLKPGGLLIAMCGQSYLDQIYSMMVKHLDYYWTACYLTPRQPTPLRQRNVNTSWKPLLIFSNGDYKGKIFGDVFTSDRNEKEMHEWQQSESGMLAIMKQICFPGQYILDPFCGSGTTGIAAISHGCLFDGIDIDIENVHISKGRVNDAAKTRQ